MDGRQIYTAIHDFVNGKFTLEGLTYEQMQQEQKIIFGEYKLQYYHLNVQIEEAFDTINRLSGNK